MVKIIQFGHGRDYIDSVECYLHKPISKDHQVILWRKWLDERKATFNKDTNILRICDWVIYYSFQVRPIGLVHAIQD